MALLKRAYITCSYHLPFGYALPPLEIVIEITYRCNLRCKMCQLHGPNAISPFTPNAKELSLREVKDFVDQIYSFSRFLPIKPSIFISGGEPFVREDIFQIMEYIKLRNIEFSIVTNGCLIDKEKAEKIVHSRPNPIIFSLDGPERIHDEIRGTMGTFAKATNAMKMIRTQASPKDLSITINCVISSLNLDHMEEMVYLANDLEANLNYQHIMFLDSNIIEEHRRITSIYFPEYDPNEYCGLLNDLYRLDTAKLVKEISKTKNRAEELDVRVSFLPNLKPRDIPKYYLNLGTWTRLERCIYPWYSVRINPYGEIHPCMEYPSGNLRDQTFREIYNGLKTRYFRSILRRERLFPACARCCKL